MKKLGFTLAEVLITLVIIGVIAAMTVPTLMNNTNAQEFRSALKKAISGANQALTLHYALEGLSANDYSDAAAITAVFKKRMSIIDGQETFTTDDCDGASKNTVFTTADGIIFCVDSTYASEVSDEQGVPCDSYNTVPCTESTDKANLWIDVNGAKNPNKATTFSSRPRDIYQAHIYAQKVVPFGEPTQEVMFDRGTEGGYTGN